MIEKVILPRDVAEGIEKLRNDGCTNYDIIHRAEGAICSEPDTTLNRWAFDKQGGTPDLLMSALVNGYEVGTPEEVAHRKVHEYYDDLKSDRELSLYGHTDNYHRLTSKLVAVRKTLNLLGITIEGINGAND